MDSAVRISRAIASTRDCPRQYRSARLTLNCFFARLGRRFTINQRGLRCQRDWLSAADGCATDAVPDRGPVRRFRRGFHNDHSTSALIELSQARVEIVRKFGSITRSNHPDCGRQKLGRGVAPAQQQCLATPARARPHPTYRSKQLPAAARA
jgi:hypothetical protein